jgi:hypothetical protein
MYLSLDASASKRWVPAHILKVGAMLTGGVGVVFMATSVLMPNLRTSADVLDMSALSSLPGPSPWKELALAAIEANNRCEVGGIKPTPRFTAALANVRTGDIEMLMSKVAPIAKKRGSTVVAMAKKQSAPAGAKVWGDGVGKQVGVFPPFDGGWDPLGFSANLGAGELAYFREAELKHGRVCMLASLGIVVQERFHPLFGGEIDGPALQSLGRTELSLFWPAVLAATGGIELLTGLGRGEGSDSIGLTPSLKSDIIPGDIGFDPLNLAQGFSDDKFVDIQNRELAHGRLAMIGTLGLILQELIFPEQKSFGA